MCIILVTNCTGTEITADGRNEAKWSVLLENKVSIALICYISQSTKSQVHAIPQKNLNDDLKGNSKLSIYGLFLEHARLKELKCFL